jgi:hypothetical protein
VTDPHASGHAPGGTPEGHTPEAAAPDEFGVKGTPAGELSPAAPHPADADDHKARHDEGTHAAPQGHGTVITGRAVGHPDEHAEEPLGPVDWRAWGASLLGVLVGVAICLALALPTLRL